MSNNTKHKVILHYPSHIEIGTIINVGIDIHPVNNFTLDFDWINVERYWQAGSPDVWMI